MVTVTMGIMVTEIVVEMGTMEMAIMDIIMEETQSPEHPLLKTLTMEFNNIKELLQKIGTAEYIQKSILGLPEEGWFLIETSPTPSKDEAIKIATDIIRNEVVAVEKGGLYHSDSCKSNIHKLSKKWLSAVEAVREEKFKIAIYPGHEGLYKGQPLVVAIDPIISYSEYPDHPHLNIGGANDDKTVLIPDTLCYTHSPEELGTILDYRIFNAYKTATIWLYRHQIWLSKRELCGKGEWIGKGIMSMDAKYYIRALEPLGECRCGSKNKYIDCHMPNDLSEHEGISLEKARNYIKSGRNNLLKTITEKFIGPKKRAIEILRKELLKDYDGSNKPNEMDWGEPAGKAAW